MVKMYENIEIEEHIASDAIRKKTFVFFISKKTCFFRIKNLTSKKNTQVFFFFLNTHLKEITS